MFVMAGHNRPKDACFRTPMSRPSTSSLLQGRKDVDARDKRGHDGIEARRLTSHLSSPGLSR
jgi:hypothetical protein